MPVHGLFMCKACWCAQPAHLDRKLQGEAAAADSAPHAHAGQRGVEQLLRGAHDRDSDACCLKAHLKGQKMRCMALDQILMSASSKSLACSNVYEWLC